MLSAVAENHFVIARVTTQRELDLEDVVAWLHQLQDTGNLLFLLLDGDPGFHVLNELVFDNLAGSVEEVLDHVEEPRVPARRDIL